MLDLLKKYRIELHQIPEIALKEFKTNNYIKNVLKNYTCKIFEIYKTSVLAYFDLGFDETLAFRADMDALKICENTNLSFASNITGYMHACGHDGHMSILLGLAKYVNDNTEQIRKNVLLIFQPAEETIGGAQGIIKTNILKKLKVTEIYGLHLWPNLEKGKIFSKPNYMMSQANEINIKIIGKSVHIANYQKGVDSLYIGCLLVNKLYKMIEECVTEENKILKFGIFKSGKVLNVISDNTLIKGSLRTYDHNDFRKIVENIVEIKKILEFDYKCEIKINFKSAYPALRNDYDLFAKVKKIIDLHELKTPVMQSEDFAFYGKTVKSLYMFVGLGNQTNLHKNDFDFDMDVLMDGLNAFIKIING